MKGLSCHPRGSLSPIDALKPAVWTHGAGSGHLPLPLPTTAASSHPHWLRPRWHAKEQYVSQAPDRVRYSSRHGWCLRPHGQTLPVVKLRRQRFERGEGEP